MAVNAELLLDTLAEIKYDKKSWDQTAWRCQTGMCFAGWAATLDGARWVTKSPDEPFSDQVVARKIDEAKAPEWEKCFVEGKTTVSAPYRAKVALGLSEDQVDDLFHGRNTYADLVLHAAAILEMSQAKVTRLVNARVKEIQEQVHQARLRKAGLVEAKGA